MTMRNTPPPASPNIRIAMLLNKVMVMVMVMVMTMVMCMVMVVVMATISDYKPTLASPLMPKRHHP